MRFVRVSLATLGAGFAASAARAAPIAVAFEGTFHSPAPIPFGGMLFYEPGVPNSSMNPESVLYRFPPGSAGIRIDLPDATLSSDPASEDVAAFSIAIYVDANGNPTNPNDPEAIRAALFSWGSFGANLPAEVRTLKLTQLVFEDLPRLPNSPAALAAALLGADVEVDAGSGPFLWGEIEGAIPVPEPSSAALLYFGVGLLAAGRAARRRRSTGPGRGSGGWTRTNDLRLMKPPL